MPLSLVFRLLGFILVSLSIFIPWYSFEEMGVMQHFSAWGVGTGNVMLILLALILGTSFFSYQRRSYFAKVLSFFFSLLAVVLVIVNNPAQLNLELTAQWGFLCGLLGSIIIFCSVLWTMLSGRD